MKHFLAGAALVLLVFGAAMTVKHVAKYGPGPNPKPTCPYDGCPQ